METWLPIQLLTSGFRYKTLCEWNYDWKKNALWFFQQAFSGQKLQLYASEIFKVAIEIANDWYKSPAEYMPDIRL